MSCFRDGVFNYFISRVRNNLHIVLCMSPVGDAFRTRCRMFPSLVNCCTIDWFTEWPRSVCDYVLHTNTCSNHRLENLDGNGCGYTGPMRKKPWGYCLGWVYPGLGSGYKLISYPKGRKALTCFIRGYLAVC